MLTQQVQEHGTAILGVGVRGEVDLLLAELGQQLGGGAGQLHAHALHAVAQLGGHGLHDGNGAVLVQVNLVGTAGYGVWRCEVWVWGVRLSTGCAPRWRWYRSRTVQPGKQFCVVGLTDGYGCMV